MNRNYLHAVVNNNYYDIRLIRNVVTQARCVITHCVLSSLNLQALHTLYDQPHRSMCLNLLQIHTPSSRR